MCLDSLMVFILLLDEEHLCGVNSIDIVVSLLVRDMHLVVMEGCLILVELGSIFVLGVFSVLVDFLNNLCLIRLLAILIV